MLLYILGLHHLPNLKELQQVLSAKDYKIYKYEDYEHYKKEQIYGYDVKVVEESIALAKKWLEDKTYSKYLDAETIVSLKKHFNNKQI